MLDDITPRTAEAAPTITREALDGLRATPKTLPAKLFYDAEGCRLFNEITGLREYYVTRTELALLEGIGPELARAVSAGATVVEYGAGSATKALLLLKALRAPAAYVPIDVAGEAVRETAMTVAAALPGLQVRPIAADFLGPIPRLAEERAGPRLGFFPGSTIGNLEPAAAVRFLRGARAALGAGAQFLVGADMRKDPAILVPAYDDSRGVTAAFNRNLLVRLNREAGANFDLAAFRHRALWNAREGRIEMHLVSTRPQTVRLGGETIAFAEGESIHTENSYKHTVDGFRALAREAGWQPMQLWTDPDALFSVHLMRTESEG
jgi:dimethylhistidine N-methyltransferase